jgi:hypothetical protein
MKIRYNITYSIVTPESAEDGDFAESGMLYDSSEATIKDFINEIIDGGYTYPSSSDPQDVRWWSTEPDVDYSTMAEETHSIHPDWSLMKPHQAARIRLAIYNALQ